MQLPIPKSLSIIPCHIKEASVLTQKLMKGAQCRKQRLESFVKTLMSSAQRRYSLLQKIVPSVGRAVLSLSLCPGGILGSRELDVWQ